MNKKNALVIIAISAVGLLTAILVTGLSILAFAQKQQEQRQQQNTNTNNSSNSSSTIIVIPQGASVTKSGQYYKPENAQTLVNSKVTWTNKDSLPHTATASGNGSNSFDTNIIQAGSSSSITFSSSKYTTGTIHYICTIHPWMTASLTLSPVSGGVPPQSQSVPSSTSSRGGTQEQQIIPVHSTVVKVLPKSSTTTAAERVIVHGTKRGDAYRLDATTGHILWKLPVGIQYNTDAKVTPNGTGPVWPGPQGGVEYATANDNKTAYFVVSNMGSVNFFPTHADPIFSAKGNGLGNGTVTAVDIKTGKIKWIYPTEFPPWTSPTITNGLVFAGHMTATGKPYQFGEFGAPTVTPLNPSGIIFALDKDTGKKLWEFNVGAPIGVEGPSIGHGILLVTTGAPASAGLANKGGDVIAFGLPSAENQTLSTSNTTK